MRLRTLHIFMYFLAKVFLPFVEFALFLPVGMPLFPKHVF